MYLCSAKHCRCFRFNPILTRDCTNRRNLLPPPPLHIASSPLVRQFSLVPVIVRSILKIRYLVLGGALGGGYSLSQARYLNIVSREKEGIGNTTFKAHFRVSFDS